MTTQSDVPYIMGMDVWQTLLHAAEAVASLEIDAGFHWSLKANMQMSTCRRQYAI